MKKTILILSLVFISILTYAQPPAFSGLDISSNSNATIYGYMEIQGLPAESGDWIAAFDVNDNLVGTVEVDIFGGAAFFLMTIYDGDNQFTDPGNMFTLKGWDSNTGTYYGDDQELGPFVPSNGGYLSGFEPDGSGLPMFTINFQTVLPIELSEFGVQKRSCDKFAIEWVTETEINNEYFSIQRSIDDIYSFETIEKIDGAGNSNSRISYTYEDEIRLSGNHTIYYRLKQTDFDGRSSYSNNISAKIDCGNGQRFNAFPNPFSSEITMSVDIAEGSQVIVNDAQGRVVFETQTSSATNNKISTVDWPEGIYIARYIHNGELIDSQKILKQH